MQPTEIVVFFFLYKNQQMHLGPSKSPPGDLHGHSQFLGEAKQTFPWFKSLHPNPAQSGPSTQPQPHRKLPLVSLPISIFIIQPWMGVGQGEATHTGFFYLAFKNRTTLAYGGLSCNPSLASYGTASLPGLSSNPITHPTALDGLCGRAG